MSKFMERVIFHIDMDAFFASVEQSDNPDLKGRAVIVGGMSGRGVVSAASYEARKQMVHSAMPVFQAKQRCPDGVFVPVRMARYKEVSRNIMEILAGYSPVIEQASIDEAYMDMSGTSRLLGPPWKVGEMIKDSIMSKCSITCSIGIAPNRFLAKIASDMEKPNGLKMILPGDVPGFIAKLPLEKVPGVGEKNLKILRHLGAYKLGDIRDINEQLLLDCVGKFGERLEKLALGRDNTAIVPTKRVKSVSSEATLPEDTKDREILIKYLLTQSEIVGRRLRSKGIKGMTISLKLKWADFKCVTRRVTLNRPVCSSKMIYEHGIRLFDSINMDKRVRLIGISVSNINILDPDMHLTDQLGLFDKTGSEHDIWEVAEETMDSIQERFGRKSISKGGLL